MDRHILLGLKERAGQMLAEAKGSEFQAMLEGLKLFWGEFAERTFRDPFFDLLITRAEKHKRDYIAGVMTEANHAAAVENLRFSFERYLGSSHQFLVVDFGKDYALAQGYAASAIDAGQIEGIRRALATARESARKTLERDVEGGIEALEEGLIQIEKEIVDHKIIDRDYLQLKHRYISLKMDLMNGIVPSPSDFYKVLSGIKEAMNVYLLDINSFAQTNLILGASSVPNSEKKVKQEPQDSNPNPLAPFSDEEIYREYAVTLKMMWLKLASSQPAEDRLLKTYILLSQEISRREIQIKDGDRAIYDNVNSLLPLNMG